MAKQSEPGRKIYRANQSFTREFEGVPVTFTPFGPYVREGHRIMLQHEHLFEPLTPDFEVDAVEYDVAAPRAEKPEYEKATAAPNEVRGK